MRLFLFLLLLSCTGLRAADTVAVAAAANLVYALDALNAAFRQLEPDTTVTVTLGASGSLVAQVRHGAPYDVFLSADLDYPQALIDAGQAEARHLVPFATGKLVLWTMRPDLPLGDVAAAVRHPAVRKLAFANPDTAPYGRAARELLLRLGVWADVQPKLVTGENITQTAQFVETGHADLGFVALSLVLSPKLKDQGRWVEIPADAAVPLTQGAVLTRRGADNPAARRYLDFLVSPAARKILEGFGYGVPAAGSAPAP
jgi:molybdate transport system substrate-binding protein